MSESRELPRKNPERRFAAVNCFLASIAIFTATVSYFVYRFLDLKGSGGAGEAGFAVFADYLMLVTFVTPAGLLVSIAICLFSLRHFSPAYFLLALKLLFLVGNISLVLPLFFP